MPRRRTAPLRPLPGWRPARCGDQERLVRGRSDCRWFRGRWRHQDVDLRELGIGCMLCRLRAPPTCWFVYRQYTYNTMMYRRHRGGALRYELLGSLRLYVCLILNTPVFMYSFNHFNHQRIYTFFHSRIARRTHVTEKDVHINSNSLAHASHP